ncbi:twin-arginine translocase subunit TatC [Haloferula rosea]|uniref:Sec-independent protein translocase protein TatC n=1 Tax=Haloferula rosea TaxID=490093 RepID=A0A934VER5_9BACT|nr:twin-arginine translocase subunit TatC [Haloferula rosea]MBK1826202.1 twin-arginine translocase subunit TatC [Haloferula rosea]
MILLQKVFKLRDDANPDMEKPFLEHLEDLRVMITQIVLTLLVSTIGCFVFQAQVMDILRKPVENVWAETVKATMPKELEVATWEKAKEILDRSIYAKPSEVDAYLGRFDEETQELIEVIRTLRLSKPLPEDQQAAFLKEAAESGRGPTDLLDELIKLEAEPDSVPGADLTMMSSLKPTETFMLSMKLAFFAGIVVSFPFLLFFVLQFVLPGLHQNEKGILWPSMAIGFGLFLVGVLFAYFIVLPRALAFFFTWDQGLGVASEWRIGWYIGFATQFTLVFGLSFELPVVIMALVKLGLLSFETMSRTRRYAILAIVVLAAVITPTGDVLTLSMMAVPMYILYEACIWLAWFDNKKKREEAEEEDSERMERLLDEPSLDNESVLDEKSFDEPSMDADESGEEEDYSDEDYGDEHYIEPHYEDEATDEDLTAEDDSDESSNDPEKDAEDEPRKGD